MLFQPAAKDCGGVFADGAIFGSEGGEEVAVNIELADNFLFNEDGDHDFRFGFEGTGEVSRVGADVVNDDSLAGGRRGAADTLIQGNARVRGHGAAKGAENQNFLRTVFFEHVETYPVVTQHFLVQEFGDALHQIPRGFRAGGEGVEFANYFTRIRVCRGHR